MSKKPKYFKLSVILWWITTFMEGVDRVSPEAPVQVVKVKMKSFLMGGAGNVINNLLSLGSKVGVCSVIGDDEGGEF